MSDINAKIEQLELLIADLTSENARLKAESDAIDLARIAVRMASPTKIDPFRSVACSVVDVGYSDRILMVECPDFVDQSRRIKGCVDALSGAIAE